MGCLSWAVFHGLAIIRCYQQIAVVAAKVEIGHAQAAGVAAGAIKTHDMNSHSMACKPSSRRGQALAICVATVRQNHAPGRSDDGGYGVMRL